MDLRIGSWVAIEVVLSEAYHVEEARIRIDSSCIIMERWEHWRGLWTYFVMTLLIGVEILLTIATSIQRTHFLNKTANGAFIRGLYLAYLWLLNNSTNFPMFFKGLGLRCDVFDMRPSR